MTITPDSVAAVNAALDAFGYGGPRVATGGFPTGYDTTNVFGRLDHSGGKGTRVEARYSLYDVSSANARNVGGLNDVSRGTPLDDTDQTAAVSMLSTPSSTIFNEARAQLTRSRLDAPANDVIGPAVNVSGVASSARRRPRRPGRDLDVVQVADTRHRSARRALDQGRRRSSLQPRRRSSFPARCRAATPSRRWPTCSAASTSSISRHSANRRCASRIRTSVCSCRTNGGRGPALTVTGGLRYDLQWLPDPIALDGDNVSPRLGVAWAPGDGRTVVRASGGLYFDRIPLRATSNALQRDGITYQTAVLSFGQPGAPVFPRGAGGVSLAIC